MKMMLGMALLACVPMAVAETNFSYPSTNLAEFVVKKLDVTSVPSTIRPKAAQGKKTLGDYGYTTVQLDDKQALVKAPQGTSQMAINVLEQNNSGIYVCVNSQGSSAGQVQQVLLLRAKGADGLLKGRVASKEFAACPVIGAADSVNSD